MNAKKSNHKRDDECSDRFQLVTRWLIEGIDNLPELNYLKALHGDEQNLLIDTLVNHLISHLDDADHQNSINAIVSRILDLDAHVPEGRVRIRLSSGGAFSNSLVNLQSTKPFQMFSRLDFQKYLTYTLGKSDSLANIIPCHLRRFLNELRNLIRTMCPRERDILENSAHVELANKSFLRDAIDSSQYLLSWVAIEASKFCIVNKICPVGGSPTEFLLLISRHVSKPINLSDKLPFSSLCLFIWLLERAVKDRSCAWSIPKQSITISKEVDDFFKTNNHMILDWFGNNELEIAKLNLRIDQPAGCLYYTQWKLQNTLYKHIDQLHKPKGSERLIYNRDTPLLTINNNSLRTNIRLLILSAKYLNDPLLLKGIKKIIQQDVILPNFKLIGLVLSNMDGRYNHTLKSINKFEDSKDETGPCIIEYLNACIEYGQVDNVKPFIDMIPDSPTRSLYESYFDSRLRKNDSPIIDIDKINSWMNTWSDINDGQVSSTSINDKLELMMPTCLNIISREPLDKRQTFLNHLDWILGKNMIAESLSKISSMSKDKLKIYHIIIQLLKTDVPRVPISYLQVHSNDLNWHQRMYRNIKDLGLIDKLRLTDDCMDIIQYKAAKFYKTRGDLERSINISDDLIKHTTRPEYQVLGRLLQIKSKDIDCATSDFIIINHSISQLPAKIASEFRLKLVRYLIKSNVSGLNHWNTDLANIPDYIDPIDLISDKQPINIIKWMPMLNESNIDTKVKTLRQFANRINQQISQKETDNECLSMNTLFDIHLRLIENGCQLNGGQFKQWVLESSVKLLKMIHQSSEFISRDNLEFMNSKTFMEKSINVWLISRDSLIAIVLDRKNLADSWHDCLVRILETMIAICPHSLIYKVISNRIKTQEKIVSFDLRYPECDTDKEDSDHRINESKVISRISFWDGLYRKLTSLDAGKPMIEQTERFVQKLRNVGFLRGDILRKLCDRLPRALYGLFTNFARACLTCNVIDKKQQIQTCEQQLSFNVKRAQTIISRLLRGEDSRIELTNYDVWFLETFKKNLNEMAYRLTLLQSKKPLDKIQASQLLKLIRSITSLAGLCRNHLNDYNNKTKNVLYTEMITAQLESNELMSVPMPDCHAKCFKSNDNDPVNICRLNQRIDVLPSKSMPKKISLLGTDGKSRSFLLKSNEDLRLDSQLMTTLDIFNEVLMVDKKLQIDQVRIRTYSVTPIGPMCGLIQWVESPSLGSFVRAWQESPNGIDKMQKLYSETCEQVCQDVNSDASQQHVNCKYPANSTIIDLYYQRIWSTLKSLRLSSLCDKRPSLATSKKLRADLEPAIFESIVESLISNGQPKELIASQLWHKSCSPHAYWIKNKNFINSCAVMSMVGYIIGLGDRHLENILLDEQTGELVHVDYGVCFELGHKLPLPEVVPFRLTPNIIYAMGFAGLEGRYTEISRRMMQLLRDKSEIVLQLLDPIHFSYLVNERSSQNDNKLCPIDAHQVERLLSSEHSHSELGAGRSRNDILQTFHKSCSSPNVLSKDIMQTKEEIKVDHNSTIQLVEEKISPTSTHVYPIEIHSQESIGLIVGDENLDDDIDNRDHDSTKNAVDSLIRMDEPMMARGFLLEQPITPTKITIVQSQSTLIAPTRALNDITHAGPMSIFSYELRPNEKDKLHLSLKYEDLIAIHGRILDKLAGTDELLRNYINNSSKTIRSDSVDSFRSDNEPIDRFRSDEPGLEEDLIRLDLVQSVGDQVNALIKQATLLKNYSQMFEGWMAWI